MDKALMRRVVSRRSFGTGALLVGAGAAATTTFGGAFAGSHASLFSPSQADAATITDADILNFALNLEYLEAEFYTMITTGRRLKDIGIGTSGTGAEGPTTGGKRMPFAGELKEILEEVAFDEQQHVRFLRTALGSARIAKPAINLQGIVAKPHFDFDSVPDVIAMARAFEDVGVSAYGGAAKYISDPNVLEAAARIALTEGQHAGNIRLLVAQYNVTTFALDGADYPPPPTGTMYFNVNKSALAKIRTTSEVLAIVYNNSTSGTSRGGLFPNGVNGTIRMV